MSEHLKTPSQILDSASFQNRHKANEVFGLLDGPDAEKAAYAAKPFMDIAVDIHEFMTAPESEIYTDNDYLGLPALVNYAERKARTALNGSGEPNEQEELVLRGYRADLRARKASVAAEEATDLYDISGDSPDQRKRDFTLLAEKRLDTVIRSSEGEDRSKYFRIRESLKARRDLVDADEEDLAVFYRKHVSDSSHVDAVEDLVRTGTISRGHHVSVVQDIRKNSQNAETDQFLAASYRLFAAQEAKNAAQESARTTSSSGRYALNAEKTYAGMTDEEFAVAKEIVAGMDSKKVPERSSIVPKNAKERQVFEREYFSDPNHTVPNEQNIKILGELVASYAEPLAEQVRRLQKERGDLAQRYPGNLRTFWFSADTFTGSNPKDGKDKLLFDYLKRELRQPSMTYGDMAGLPMDKVAKMMRVDLRSVIPDYDSVFSTPQKKPEHRAVYEILDAQ